MSTSTLSTSSILASRSNPFPTLVTPSLSLEGRKTEELENPGSNIEAATDIEDRIEILNRTREETNNSESARGCILTQNLNKQIQRRRLQLLDSLQVPSREVSVIRCSSTPDPKNCREHFSFGEEVDIEASQPSSSEPPFKVFIDNPSEFYSLQTPVSPHSIEEEVLPSNISLVATDESDLNMADNVDPKKELERKFLVKAVKLGSALRLYESSKFPKEVLAAKEKEWTAIVDAHFQELINYTDV